MIYLQHFAVSMVWFIIWGPCWQFDFHTPFLTTLVSIPVNHSCKSSLINLFVKLLCERAWHILSDIDFDLLPFLPWGWLAVSRKQTTAHGHLIIYITCVSTLRSIPAYFYLCLDLIGVSNSYINVTVSKTVALFSSQLSWIQFNDLTWSIPKSEYISSVS